jgi:hypothetical protein
MNKIRRQQSRVFYTTLPTFLFVLIAFILAGKGYADKSVSFDINSNRISVHYCKSKVEVPLTDIRFNFEKETVTVSRNCRVSAEQLERGEKIEVQINKIDLTNSGSLETKVHLHWSPDENILRKWISYRINGEKPPLLRKIILDEREIVSKKNNLHISENEVQSYPVFDSGYFAGIEYPIASTNIKKSLAEISHFVGERLKPGKWYQSRKIIYGFTKTGYEVETFKQYISKNRPEPNSLYFNYNSWWTTSWAFSQEDILNLLEIFENNLYRPYKIAPDSFALDLGWSEPNSIWGINNERFPAGFTNITKAAEKAGTKLGIWFSPSAYYTEYGALNTKWAQKQDYEYNSGKLCLAGRNYFNKLKDKLTSHIRNYKIAHIKVDGLDLVCSQSGHNHPEGQFSSPYIGENAVKLFSSFRRANPDIWIEATCFGWNPSPWWLFHVNCVLGTHGDDAPWGVVPSPIYRYSLTTARDYFNLQGAVYSKIPISAQQVFGIIHQSDEPFIEDGINAIMRGHNFIPLYFNPKYMNDIRWKTLAELMKWAKQNKEILNTTEVLLPKSWQNGKTPRFKRHEKMPRQVYGYAHWQDDKGLVHLRNPWIEHQNYEFKIQCKGNGLCAVSIYPEQRTYAKKLKHGQAFPVTLRPYETLVLHIKENDKNTLPPAAASVKKIEIESKNVKAQMINYQVPKKALGKNYTVMEKARQACTKLNFTAELNNPYENAVLYMLLEDKEKKPSAPANSLTLNGKTESMIISDSNTGFAATETGPENWLFLKTKLQKGKNSISLELSEGYNADSINLWIWAFDKITLENNFDTKSKIAQPEIFSLESVCLMTQEQLEKNAEILKKPGKIEKINGVYLDSLDYISAEQSWSKPRKNQSITEKKIRIGKQDFLRGIGTHATSEIVYSLDEKFSTFQAFAGVDIGGIGSVVFEVYVDDEKKWSSGILKAGQAPVKVIVDIKGAEKLTLCVKDAGDGIISDHADWADAKLLY